MRAVFRLGLRDRNGRRGTATHGEWDTGGLNIDVRGVEISVGVGVTERVGGIIVLKRKGSMGALVD